VRVEEKSIRWRFKKKMVQGRFQDATTLAIELQLRTEGRKLQKVESNKNKVWLIYNR
jgi:hypothetical protein